MAALRWLVILVGAAFAKPAPAAALECGAGSHHDDARSAQIATLLARTDDGKALLARSVAPPQMCFGAPATIGVLEGDTLILDARLSETRAAARAGHLLLHRIEHAPGEPPADVTACDAWVVQARAAEERAVLVESRIVRSLSGLGLDDPTNEVARVVAEYAARCRH